MDELYEAFCIQSRLREGASRMKQAFSSSPSTKGTKESIAEVNRRYKEYTEVCDVSRSNDRKEEKYYSKNIKHLRYNSNNSASVHVHGQMHEHVTVCANTVSHLNMCFRLLLTLICKH